MKLIENNLIKNLVIRLGFRKKPERVGIKIVGSSNGKIIDCSVSGFDKGIDAKNTENLEISGSRVD